MSVHRPVLITLSRPCNEDAKITYASMFIHELSTCNVEFM